MTNMQHVAKISNAINAVYHKASVKLGLADSEMLILYLLDEEQAAWTQSGIIKVSGMSKQTVNSAVLRLVKAGWLSLGVREGRQRALALTDKGKAMAEAVLGPWEKGEERIFNGWSEQEKGTFLSLSQRYLSALLLFVDSLPRVQRNIE